MLFILLWFALLIVFIGSYVFYYVYLRMQSKKAWNLRIDRQFAPPVTVLVPVHNEENLIQKKLANAECVSYPKNKLEIIVIDDGSTDQTIIKARDFAENHPHMSLRILSQNPRKGKAHALNMGLAHSKNEIVIVSDADAFWASNILEDSIPYLADPKVGAITGRQVPENIGQTWVAKAETNYLDFMSSWRLGESKVHSTIRFEGVFCAFKKEAFTEFDCKSGADDSGTALQVVQNNYRAIIVPEAAVPSAVQHVFADRIKAKTRRATQLTGLWFQCFKLLWTGHLKMPKRLAIPEIFLSLFAPFIFVALFVLAFLLFIIFPILLLLIVPLLFVILVVPHTRIVFVQGLTDQFILFYSIILNARKKKFLTWEK